MISRRKPRITVLAVLSSNHLARRWRENNEQKILSPLPDDEEEAWRTRNLELLSQAHTLCGVQHLSFEIVDSNFGVHAIDSQ